jgi:C-terminal processing protease CtpA/Prc
MMTIMMSAVDSFVITQNGNKNNAVVVDDVAKHRHYCYYNNNNRHYMISSGFSFNDGNQILVSVQKPMGILLEQQEQEQEQAMVVVVEPIVVSNVDPNGSAARAGVQVGDRLLAVQNADVSTKPLEEVLTLIGQAPKVVNLRFQRRR